MINALARPEKVFTESQLEERSNAGVAKLAGKRSDCPTEIAKRVINEPLLMYTRSSDLLKIKKYTLKWRTKEEAVLSDLV